MTKIFVNEFFSTIQGEATFVGTPSFFIRLQGCPVGCGFCDTKYTWYINDTNETNNIHEIKNENNRDTPTYINLTTQEILSLCQQNTANHIVFTGGEPCLYDLTTITKQLHDTKRFSTQIETSGTHEINCDPRTWVTLSPKIGMAGGYTVLESSYKRANEIKFPIGKQKHIDNLMQILDQHDFKNIKIWLQPLSQSKKSTDLCVELAMKENFNLSLQTHKFINMR